MNIKGALSGDITRLRYVPRFSNCRRTHTESVAEHSFFTTMYGYMLARHAEDKGVEIDWKYLSGYLIFHDAEEAVSGDFPRSFKYSSPALKHHLDAAAKRAALKVFDSFGGLIWINLWERAKDEECIEGRIVRLADFLSAISYLLQETESGNRFILEKENSVYEYANLFINNELYEVFSDLWSDITDVINKLEAHHG